MVRRCTVIKLGTFEDMYRICIQGMCVYVMNIHATNLINYAHYLLAMQLKCLTKCTEITMNVDNNKRTRKLQDLGAVRCGRAKAQSYLSGLFNL